ncbi:MAG: UDP-N-acetylglucosamine pyrophosphorylase [Clostridia bacterium]|nr:UDP-N-acetylglucosamine pyrophosphorylase [Clostridia bacterium]
MYTISELFDLTRTEARGYLSDFTYPFEALEGLKAFIETLGETLGEEYEEVCPKVWVHTTAVVSPTAYIGAPCIIGAHTEVRHCAFIRGSALIGKNCVVGNSTEIKNAILFDGVQAPHYNYIGDSILGFKAHVGAGAITSNVKSDKTPVVLKDGERRMETGRKKVGAMLGDFVEVGCNSVLNPGTIVGRRASVYPLSCVRGTVRENAIYKNANEIVVKE